nr:MAG TPA: hypothetical protein [Caudoviricetes sp.]
MNKIFKNGQFNKFGRGNYTPPSLLNALRYLLSHQVLWLLFCIFQLNTENILV